MKLIKKFLFSFLIKLWWSIFNWKCITYVIMLSSLVINDLKWFLHALKISSRESKVPRTPYGIRVCKRMVFTLCSLCFPNGHSLGKKLSCTNWSSGISIENVTYSHTCNCHSNKNIPGKPTIFRNSSWKTTALSADGIKYKQQYRVS